MGIEISEYNGLRERAKMLGLNEPEGLSLLPRNFDTAKNQQELLHEDITTTIRVLFRNNNINECRIEPEGSRIACIQQNDYSLILPVICIGLSALNDNPDLVSGVISVIANYASVFFKGIPGAQKVDLKIIVEDKSRKRLKKVHYSGPVDGLAEVSGIVEKVFDNEN